MCPNSWVATKPLWQAYLTETARVDFVDYIAKVLYDSLIQGIKIANFFTVLNDEVFLVVLLNKKLSMSFFYVKKSR